MVITGNNLKIEDVVKVARHNEKVELHPDAVKRNNCMQKNARTKSRSARNNVWCKHRNR